ncbi:MAG: HK97 gp10 family phage protein [Planctomycetia bacterium]|nr:HK97 gp10 family phage protein [Planctomycetia bacterium]
MTSSAVAWHGKTIQHLTRVEAVRRVNKAAVILHAQIIENISIPTRAAGPSLPHNFPHADTGRLRQSVVIVPATVATMTAKIGTNYKVGRWLELGTKRMLARSFLRRTLREMRSTIQRVFRNG